MKKYFIMAAVAMLVFASCTNDEDQSEPLEINFSAFNFKPTRAPITGTAYTKADGCPAFGVFATLVSDETKTYESSTDEDRAMYMTNVMIDYNDDETYKIWAPKSGTSFIKYYWPLTGKLTFVGYTPYAISGKVTFNKSNKTLTITDYSPSEIVADQYDVMYSKANGAHDLSTNGTDYTGSSKQGVNIVFNHALSQIVFRAKTDKEYTDAAFVIDYIQVNNVLNIGNLKVEDDAVSNVSPVVDGWTTSGTAVGFEPVSNTSELSKDLETYGDALLLIPQNFSNSVTVDIKYTMTPDNGLPSSKIVSIIINDDTKINLDRINAGKKYFIDLTVSANEILFAPSIPVDWADQTAQPDQDLDKL